METDFIPSDEHDDQVTALNVQMDDLRAQLDAAMTTIADLRDTIATDYVPLADMREATRQLRALNGALVELQEANTVLRARVIESDQLFANFRDDCRAQPECARAMRLD
jgi:predicted  nucleic acid-binding Zn-ribbon protein